VHGMPEVTAEETRSGALYLARERGAFEHEEEEPAPRSRDRWPLSVIARMDAATRQYLGMLTSIARL
jgi:hypothetical protein